MNRLKYVIFAFLCFILAGCGQTVIETLNVPGGLSQNSPGIGRTVVILPFADYSRGDIHSALRRDISITESLTDNLVKQGFTLPIQEDVFGYLVKENIIQHTSHKPVNTKSLDLELANEWSDTIKEKVLSYKNQVETTAQEKDINFSQGVHSVTTNTLAKLGRHFNADYIIRGRILEYKTRDEATWAPWKKGVLPFVYAGSNRIIHGFADSDAYDLRNESLTGMWVTGRVGYKNATWPAGDPSTNAITWGAIGYFLGEVSHTSGQVDQATVQMRLWVQEASTGNVIWTNRIRVLVSPETVFADNQYDTLFSQAIEKGVSALVANFVSYGL